MFMPRYIGTFVVLLCVYIYKEKYSIFCFTFNVLARITKQTIQMLGLRFHNFLWQFTSYLGTISSYSLELNDLYSNK